MLNGAEGLGEIDRRPGRQGLTILDSVKKNLAGSAAIRAGSDDGEDDDGDEPRALPGGTENGSTDGRPAR